MKYKFLFTLLFLKIVAFGQNVKFNIRYSEQLAVFVFMQNLSENYPENTFKTTFQKSKYNTEKYKNILSKLDSLYVIGWSDGANAALILAKSRPEKVKKLIISGANYKLSGFSNEALEECKKVADTSYVKKELKGWIKYGRQKIFFITDGHPAHKTKKLKA